MEYNLRKILEEIIQPGQGDDENVEIEDPNNPEKKSKEDKMKYKPHANKIEVYDSGRTKLWMP